MAGRLGRPPVGPQVMVRIPTDTLAELDRQAGALGVTRAALIRRILSQWIDAGLVA
jgi:hypothetical protein